MLLFAFGILGGHLMQPRMEQLHLKKYAVETTPQFRKSAERSFAILQGASMVLNILVICGVVVYLWHVTKPVTTARFTTVNRFTN